MPTDRLLETAPTHCYPTNSYKRDRTYDWPHGSPDDIAEPVSDRLAVLPDGIFIRRTPPGQPTVDEVVRPGDVIERPYGHDQKVFRVLERDHYGIQTVTLVIGDPEQETRADGLPKRYSGRNLSELVYQDGAIRHLYWSNDYEIAVVGSERIDVEYQATLEAGWSA